METKDLTQEPPRSAKILVGGYAILGRTIDKCRADFDGKIGEYRFDCPLDNRLFSFKGVTGADFKTAVKNAKSDLEVVAWLNANGTNKTPAEIQAWTMQELQGSIYSNLEKREWFSGECKKLGLDPAKTTTFEWLDADDKASFSCGDSCSCSL